MTALFGCYNFTPLFANPFFAGGFAPAALPLNFFYTPGYVDNSYLKNTAPCWSQSSYKFGDLTTGNYSYNNYSYKPPSNYYMSDFSYRLFAATGYSSGNYKPSQNSFSTSSYSWMNMSNLASSGSGVYNSKALPEIANSSLMKRVPANTKAKILDAVDRACKKYNVNPKLVISMMYAESGFNPNATSRCGAAGLMQLMPATAKAYGANNPYDIEQNIFAGVKFLKYLLDRYNGNTDLAVAAYNAGPGRVKTSVPNIKETKNYVAKVNRTYSSLC